MQNTLVFLHTSIQLLSKLWLAQLQQIGVHIPILLFVMLTALTACNSVRSTETTTTMIAEPMAVATATPTTSSPQTLVDPTLPTAIAGHPEWEYQRETTADFDGDGIEERAMLIARVQVLDDGRPVWDDSQPWQLYIEEPDNSRTYVYARNVHLGRVEAILTQAKPGQLPSIVLIEQTPQQLSINEITYRGGQQVEVDELVRRSLNPADGFAGTPN